jgi:hypothetical protein
MGGNQQKASDKDTGSKSGGFANPGMSTDSQTTGREGHSGMFGEGGSGAGDFGKRQANRDETVYGAGPFGDQ